MKKRGAANGRDFTGGRSLWEGAPARILCVFMIVCIASREHGLQRRTRVASCPARKKLVEAPERETHLDYL